MASTPDRPDLGPAPTFDHDVRLEATVSERDDGPDQCTIFPLVVSNRDERRSAWITAEGDAFVDAAAIR